MTAELPKDRRHDAASGRVTVKPGDVGDLGMLRRWLVQTTRRLTRVAIIRLAASSLMLVLAVPVHAQRSLSLDRGRAQLMLKTVARQIEKEFYDPALKGLDWEALTEQASQQIEAVETPGEMFTAIFGLVNSLEDSHTVFVAPQRTVRYRFGFEAQAYGNEIRVSEVEPGGAAARAGLEAGDRILQVNGFNADRESFDLMMLFFRVLRPVAEFALILERSGTPPFEIRIVADAKRMPQTIDLTDIANIYRLIREVESGWEEFLCETLDGGVGYLRLPNFRRSRDTLKGFARKLRDDSALIIDLRGNPGGKLASLESFIGFFEESPTVVAELVGREETEQIEIKPQKPHLRAPLFILVDSQSASAAEIFARHFQRAGRAVVIGDHTAGRVTLARLHGFQVGYGVVVPYAVQVSTARVVFPGNEELEGTGVTPDEICLPTSWDLNHGRDPCLARAKATARKALSSDP